ncbi:MAG: hypothetical protein NTV21_01090 [Planctomycetota bacterium]|nr:hypothetical protein [Planctomycetota bacterium]
MLSMVFLIPVGFGLVVWRSFRTAGERQARGEQLYTPGAKRWEADSVERR